MNSNEIKTMNKEFREANRRTEALVFHTFKKLDKLYDAIRISMVGKRTQAWGAGGGCYHCKHNFGEGELVFKRRKAVSEQSCCKKCFFEKMFFTPEESERVAKILKDSIEKQYGVFKKYEEEIDKHNVVVAL